MRRQSVVLGCGVVLLAGCVPSKPIDALNCPCAAGWSCDDSRNVCVRRLDAGPGSGDSGAREAPASEAPTQDAAAVKPDVMAMVPETAVTPPPDTRRMYNRTPDPLPSMGWPPNSGAMAYDSARHSVLMFPGSVFVMPTFTRFPVWEWDGSAWSDRTSAAAPVWPEGLQNVRAAYDSARHVTVVFGGLKSFSPTPFSAETWEWDGAAFARPQPMISPPGRHSEAITYDPVHQATLIFGGWGEAPTQAFFQDLWRWDGQAWTDLTPSPLPAAWPVPRTNATFVWDSRRQKAVLFGGLTHPAGAAQEAPAADLWEWDGTAWTDLTPAVLGDGWPLKRYDHAAGYDPERGVMLVIGGRITDRRAPAVASGRDLWEWDPVSRVFRELTPPTPPASWPLASSSFLGTFDVARGRLVFMNGAPDSSEMARWLFEYGP